MRRRLPGLIVTAAALLLVAGQANAARLSARSSSVSRAAWLRLAGAAALALLAIAAAPAGAQDFRPGSKSLGDPLLPQIGNGGYDVRHYAIDLDYDPDANRLEPGTGSRSPRWRRRTSRASASTSSATSRSRR